MLDEVGYRLNELRVLRHQLICNWRESVCEIEDLNELIDSFSCLFLAKMIFLDQKLLQLGDDEALPGVGQVKQYLEEYLPLHRRFGVVVVNEYPLEESRDRVCVLNLIEDSPKEH